MPILIEKLINLNNITIDSKSGYSGAGKKFEKKFTHKNIFNSTFAYGINFHRHVCEIDQEFLKIVKKKVQFTFNPHLLPTFRGILSTIYVEPRKNISINKIRNALIQKYKNCKFIKIMKLNTPLGSGNVLNTNNCEISVCNTRNRKKIVIFCAIDNLLKGASGQAIQNMNLIYGFPEDLGFK